MQKHHASQYPAPVNALPVGTRLQEFEIKAVIGEGGFGVVYRADDTLLGREVAIKEYLPASHATRLADGTVVASSERQREMFEKARQGFVAEARMLARFKHPALVDVLRFWEAQGTAYMVMPYYRGRSLQAQIQTGFRLKDDTQLQAFLTPLLDGLAQLHAAHCYHRDISTDNILMLENGQPLLLDFGAARSILVDKADLATVILKPGFAPVEQYSDDPVVAPQGAWTDLYALCAVTYQAITGVMPTVSVARVIRDPLVPLVQSAPTGFSPALLAAIDAGLRVKPAERPQSVQAFCALMQSAPALAPAPVSTPVPTPAPAPTVPSPLHAAQPTHELPAQPDTVSHPAQPVVRKRAGWWFSVAVVVAAALVGLYRLLPLDDEPTPPAPDTAIAPTVPTEPTVPTVPETPEWPQPDPALTDVVVAQTARSDDPPENLPDPAWLSVGTEIGEAETRALEDALLAAEAMTTEATAALLDEALEAPFEHTQTDFFLQGGDPGNGEAAVALAQPEPRANTDFSATTDPADNPVVVHSDTGSEPEQVALALDSQDEAAALSPTTGTVVVRVIPWGDVYVNGEKKGRSLANLALEFAAPPGMIDIEIRNTPQRIKYYTVQVVAGRKHPVNYDFTR